MDKKEIICTVCPKGCRITAETDGKNVLSVTGYSCKRGEVYAKAECVNPVRVLTTTVMTDKNTVASVKTAEAIPKNLIFDAMKVINGVTAKTPLNVGDIVLSNILNTGVNVIATSKTE